MLEGIRQRRKSPSLESFLRRRDPPVHVILHPSQFDVSYRKGSRTSSLNIPTITAIGNPNFASTNILVYSLFLSLYSPPIEFSLISSTRREQASIFPLYSNSGCLGGWATVVLLVCNYTSGTMSSEEVRRVSREDIQLVQNLIEQCLQLHMSKKEVMNTLLVKAKIEPGFTDLVWQKLEEENPEFFKAYHLRLLVKDQIVQFNRLLERQVELMHQVTAGPTTAHMSNGSHIPLMSQNSACYGQEYSGPALQAGDMHQSLGSSLYTNGSSSSVNPCMQGTVDNVRRINTSSNMLMAQSSNMGLVQGMNGQLMKPGTGYINGSPCMFGPNGDVLDARLTAGDMSVSSYSSVESHSQPINNTLLGSDSAYESLGPISRNFSLSDLTADFSLGSDILESYSGSPFLGAGSDSFLNPQYRVEQQDNRRLDTISEGLSYDNFGSD